MPTQPASWTRRQFAQTLAAAATTSILPPMALASPSPVEQTAFVASAENVIHVFQVSGSRWSSHQTIPAASPIHLTLHPTLPILYALHQTALWDNLPRGAVSAYTISPSGHLALRHTQPLSLSAVNPRHAAVTPDGTAIAVVSPESGIFNILPLALDGSLQPPTIIRKDLSPTTAETHSIFFLPEGKTLLTSDSSRRPLNAFIIEGDLLIPTAIAQVPPATPADATSLHIPPTIPSPTSIAFRPA